MKQYVAHCQAGYYQYDRTVFVNEKLDHMPYAQAGIIYKPGNVIMLVSYETIVCEINDGWLHCYGTFSQTTAKHIGAFMKQFGNGLSYHNAKRCYENNEELNIYTGEIRPAAAGMIQTIGIKNNMY